MYVVSFWVVYIYTLFRAKPIPGSIRHRLKMSMAVLMYLFSSAPEVLSDASSRSRCCTSLVYQAVCRRAKPHASCAGSTIISTAYVSNKHSTSMSLQLHM